MKVGIWVDSFRTICHILCIIFANFIQCGNIPVYNDCFTMILNGYATMSPIYLIGLVEMLSWPALDFGFKLLIHTRCISVLKLKILRVWFLR